VPSRFGVSFFGTGDNLLARLNWWERFFGNSSSGDIWGEVARSIPARDPYDDLARAVRAVDIPMPADRPAAPVAISRPRGRPSYEATDFLTPSAFQRIPVAANFGLYAALREMVPILNAAISKKRKLIGCPVIDGKPETKREVTAWLNSLAVNHIQTGWGNWIGTWTDNALLYGRAHTEIILNSDQSDVYGAQELHPKTVSLRSNRDRYSVDVVQQQSFGVEPVTLPPLRMLNLSHDIRGDDPNGTSILWGLPFITEIMGKMLKNLGSTWDRYGTPRYHINWMPSEDFSDPNGTESDAIMSGLAEQFVGSLESGIQGDIVDFYTSGKVTIEIIGANGESLNIEVPMRAISEQVVATTHIPPFAFGFHWANGDVMTQLQADLLTVDIKNLRGELQGPIEYLIDFRQRLTGGDRNIKLIWPQMSLIDIFNLERANFFKQNARQIQYDVGVKLWRVGVLSRWDFAREARPELDHLTNEEIDERLPDLELEPPEEMGPGDNGSGRTGTGGGGGENPGSLTGRAAIDRELDLANGNGHR